MGKGGVKINAPFGGLEPFSNNNNNNNTLLSHFVFYFRIHNTLGTNAFIDRPSHIRLLIVTSRDGRTFLLHIHTLHSDIDEDTLEECFKRNSLGF